MSVNETEQSEHILRLILVYMYRKINRCVFFITIALLMAYFLTSQKKGISHTDSGGKCPSLEDMIAERVQMNNPCLVDYIRTKRLVLPSSKAYNFSGSVIEIDKEDQVLKSTPLESFRREYNSPWTEALIAVETLLPKHGQRRFLECGALDGATFSTTIHMERFLNWTGVLIEADPRFYKFLRIRNRKAYAVHACASSETYPTKALFQQSNTEALWFPGQTFAIYNPGDGRILHNNQQAKANSTPIEVACVPIYTILLATETTKLDLVVLDVEGMELSILKTIPFTKVDIGAFLIEVAEKTANEKKELRDFLESKGYSFHLVYEGRVHPADALFIKSEYYDRGKLNKVTAKDAYKIILGKEVSDDDFLDFEIVFRSV